MLIGIQKGDRVRAILVFPRRSFTVRPISRSPLSPLAARPGRALFIINFCPSVYLSYRFASVSAMKLPARGSTLEPPVSQPSPLVRAARSRTVSRGMHAVTFALHLAVLPESFALLNSSGRHASSSFDRLSLSDLSLARTFPHDLDPRSMHTKHPVTV